MRIGRLIASAAIAAVIATASAAYAFETTSIGGVNADGSANFQDPSEQDINKAIGNFGSLQFGVSGSNRNNTADASDEGRPPWELKPTPPMRSFYSSGGSMFRGQ